MVSACMVILPKVTAVATQHTTTQEARLLLLLHPHQRLLQLLQRRLVLLLCRERHRGDCLLPYGLEAQWRGQGADHTLWVWHAREVNGHREARQARGDRQASNRVCHGCRHDEGWSKWLHDRG